jgi:hypothetical protein
MNWKKGTPVNKMHILCAVVWLLLCWPATGMSQTQTPPNFLAKPEATSEYVKYEGTLICFRCDVMRTQESKARCKHEGHASLLKRTEGRTHRLYGSKHSITEKLSSEELHGKKVKIEGIYDTETNWLLVEKVDLVEP